MYSSITIATDIGRRQKSNERCLLQTDYRLDATLSIMVPCTYRITPCMPQTLVARITPCMPQTLVARITPCMPTDTCCQYAGHHGDTWCYCGNHCYHGNTILVDVTMKTCVTMVTSS